MYGLHLKRGGIYEQLWCRSLIPDAARSTKAKMGNNGIELHNGVFVLRLIQVCTRKYKNWESIPTAICVRKMRTTIVWMIKVVSTNFHHATKQIFQCTLSNATQCAWTRLPLHIARANALYAPVRGCLVQPRKHVVQVITGIIAGTTIFVVYQFGKSPMNPDLGSNEVFPATSLEPKIGAILRGWLRFIANSKAHYTKNMRMHLTNHKTERLIITNT